MDAETQSDSYVKIMEWVHARRKPLLIGAIVVVVAGLACAVVSWKKDQDASDANAQFFAAPNEGMARGGPVSAAPLLEVAREYPSTPAGEHALALGAEELFTEGKYPEAYQHFSDFVATYPDSPLIPEAKLGIAASLEAQGKIQDAITKYHEIILAYPSEPSLVSPAKLTLARLYEEGGQAQQALSYYAELARMIQQNPYDPWAAEAQERAQLLLYKHPELMKAMTSAAAPPAPSSGFTLPATPGKPAGAVPPAAPAPKTAPAPNGLQLLKMPAGSSNGTGKP
jgi:tetratricopeptide (TPR) repeat protein